MFINKVLISTLTVLFCLGLAGIAMAYEYDEEVFGQTDSTMQMKVEHEKMVEAEEALAPKHDMKAEKKASPIVLCAANMGPETSPEYEPATIGCYGS